jgi:hypothetical protein
VVNVPPRLYRSSRIMVGNGHSSVVSWLANSSESTRGSGPEEVRSPTLCEGTFGIRSALFFSEQQYPN